MRRCEECGKEIPEKRLRAVPDTRYCVKCQELYGKGKILAHELGDAEAIGAKPETSHWNY